MWIHMQFWASQNPSVMIATLLYLIKPVVLTRKLKVYKIISNCMLAFQLSVEETEPKHLPSHSF